MDVAEYMLDCVVYIGYAKGSDEPTVAATGFFVGRASTAVHGWVHTYIVTARHVIDQILDLQAKVYLRVNVGVDGDARWIETTSAWVANQNKNVDIAVNRFEPPEDCRYLTVPTDMFLSDPADPDYQRYGNMPPNVGLGDEVLITGLFYQHMGRSRNLPIARAATIAALRKEEVYTQVRPASHREPYALVDAYLVETRSFSGLSGSPAFIYETKPSNLRGLKLPDRAYSPKTNQPIHFLGLVQGHFDEPGLADNKMATVVERLNVGISVVIPSARVMDVLRQHEIVEAERLEDSELLRNGWTPRSNVVAEDN